MNIRKKIKEIALISPKRPLWSKSPKIFSMFEKNKQYLKPWYTPSLSLLTIAGATPKNIKINFFDEDFEEIDFNRNYDLVGLSSMTQQVFRAYEIADEFRSRKVPVVMGGIHATVLPEEALQHVDTVIIGEGEVLWQQYLKDFEKGKTKRIYKNPTIYKYDLTKSPMPRYDLLKKKYIKKSKDFFNMIPIQVSRGCPHDCSFCLVSKIYGKKIRKKNIGQIIEEIKTIKNTLGNQLIVFADDNLFVNKQFTKSLLNALLPLNIKWFAQSDVSIVDDDELLKLAYLSGCLMLLIGFESLNEANLITVNHNHWKMKQFNKYSEAVKKIQENGIIVYAAFIIGLENDETSTFKIIRDFMISNHCTGQFTILTPLPGTRLYNKLQKEGRLFNESYWDKCNFFDVVFKHNNMSKQEIEDGLIWLYNEIFNSKLFSNRAEYMKNIFKRLNASLTMKHS